MGSTAKRGVNLYLDAELVEEAKRRGVKLSKVVNEFLRSYLKAGPGGFEPPTFGLEGRRPVQARPRAQYCRSDERRNVFIRVSTGGHVAVAFLLVVLGQRRHALPAFSGGAPPVPLSQ